MDPPTVVTERSFVNAAAVLRDLGCNDRLRRQTHKRDECCSQWREMYYNVGMIFVVGNVALLFVTVGLFVVTVSIKKPR
jgi:hypothetical protein